MKRKLPQAPAEWQAAVDAAAALRVIADCRMYGLLEGGPEIDTDRCDEILAAGSKRGVMPSKPTNRLAAEMIRSINSQT